MFILECIYIRDSIDKSLNQDYLILLDKFDKKKYHQGKIETYHYELHQMK